jgi:hypothetical protein
VCSINQNGSVAGKIEDEKDYHDFIWTPQNGLELLPIKTCSSLPFINNSGQLVTTGWLEKSVWFGDGSKLKHFFVRTFKDDIQKIDLPASWPTQELGSWQTEKYWDNHALAVLSVNDSGHFLVADFYDPTQAKKFAVWIPENSYWSKGHYEKIEEQTLHQAFFINNQNIILGKLWLKSEKDSQRYIALYDLSNHQISSIFIDKGYTLTGFNDKNQIIGWKSTQNAGQLEGFLWDPVKGLQNLGHFLPNAINNKGQMVGNLKSEETALEYYFAKSTNAIAKIGALKPHLWTPCVWLDDHAIPLKELINFEDMPWTAILNLNGINDQGEIIGHALLDQKIQAILLRPNP